MIIVKKFNITNSLQSLTGALLLLLGLYVTQGERGAMAQEEDDVVPEYFVDLQRVIPGIRVELRYFSEDNFVGQVIDGYRGEKLFMTREAATALSGVQSELEEFGLGLKVFDAYRPQRAVDHFVRWAQDLSDRKMKAVFYPSVAKEDLFSAGYIAARSGHSRGSTIDLTIIDSRSGNELEMGTAWDFFDPASWPSYQEVSTQARANRNLLNAVMTKHGFRALPEEWWHFTLVSEPYPDTYFDFPIE